MSFDRLSLHSTAHSPLQVMAGTNEPIVEGGRRRPYLNLQAGGRETTLFLTWEEMCDLAAAIQDHCDKEMHS